MTPILPLESARVNPLGYYRPWWPTAASRDVGSTVSLDKDKFQVSCVFFQWKRQETFDDDDFKKLNFYFQVNLDVQHFSPNEITVRTKGDNTIEIEGKHEEKPDEHGFISRHFVRRYVLPKGHDINQVQSNLSSDGVLTISAPRVENGGQQQRTVPIQQTGKPSKPVEDKSKQGKNKQ